MEIVSYVLRGALEHKDSMGTGSVLRPGDVQRMSAGTGVTHSEFNHSATEPLRFLQIWIHPRSRGLRPEYEERRFEPAEKAGRLRLIASPAGDDGSLRIHQDVRIYATLLGGGEEVSHRLARGRHAWVQVANGSLLLNDLGLERGDGAAVSEEGELRLRGVEPAELLLFDLG
jgi:redox-sensitive bicupin YhaK (pirin superfamily)